MTQAVVNLSEDVVAALSSDRDVEQAAAAAATRYRRNVIFWRTAILVGFLGSWELAGRFNWIDPFFYAMPSTILGRLVDWITEGTSEGPLWYHLWVTMEESLIGFFTGSIAGVVIGIALGRNRMASDVFSIYIKLINSVPRVVLAPIFIMLFGLGLASKVALAFVMVFFVVFSNAFQGVREADRAMIANAQILGASPFQITRSVVIPSAMSWILASLHVSFGFALVGAVVGEYLGAIKGLGLMIATAQGTFNPNGVFAAMIILAVLALVVEYLITIVENRLVKWRPAPFNEQA